MPAGQVYILFDDISRLTAKNRYFGMNKLMPMG